MVDISVVLPAYLEEENLKNILPAIHDALNSVKHEIVVVDTLEPMDNTKQVCEANNARYVNREGGNFYGDAIRTGIIKACGKYLVLMDADGSHDPKDICRFYERILTGKYDLIIGSRYCKGGTTDNDFILKAMSWALNFSYSVAFSLNLKDVSDSYRLYKSEQIKNIDLECSNFDIVEEILIKLTLQYPGYRMLEEPIFFNKRAAGESKRNLLKFIMTYVFTMIKLLKIRHNYKRK